MYSPSDPGKRAAPAEGGRAKSVVNTDVPLGTSTPLMRPSSDGGAVSPAAMDVEALMLGIPARASPDGIVPKPV